MALQLKQGTCLIVTFPVTDFFIPPNKTINFFLTRNSFRIKWLLHLKLVLKIRKTWSLAKYPSYIFKKCVCIKYKRVFVEWFLSFPQWYLCTTAWKLSYSLLKFSVLSEGRWQPAHLGHSHLTSSWDSALCYGDKFYTL